MKLEKLIEDLHLLKVTGDTSIEVDSIAYDSRKVAPGSVFIALQGLRYDGADFVSHAVKRGARAVMLPTERPRETEDMLLENPVTLLISKRPRKDMAAMACRLNGFPSKSLRVVGITGTNGKTTTTYIAESILKAAGISTGVVGTINYRSSRAEAPARQTTPEAVDLQNIFRKMAKERTEVCLLEVSSHALDMQRVWGTSFETVVFTNLSQDHLDFHDTMGNYFNAKRKLFRDFSAGTAVINVDDPWGVKLMAESTAKIISYGLAKEALIRAVDINLSLEEVKFRLICPKGSCSIRSPLTGRHNVYNILAASAIAVSVGVDAHHIQAGIASLETVPGRFQRVDAGQSFLVIVDYAHTEDALRKVLEEARGLCTGKLVVLFGCGGDRDKGKRPLMGKVAARLADYTIITSDNPRSEDPLDIMRQIERGFLSVLDKPGAYKIIPDRREAIVEAISSVSESDMAIIAGKGHETYQVVGKRVLPFDDVSEAKAAIIKMIA